MRRLCHHRNPFRKAGHAGLSSITQCLQINIEIGRHGFGRLAHIPRGVTDHVAQQTLADPTVRAHLNESRRRVPVGVKGRTGPENVGSPRGATCGASRVERTNHRRSYRRASDLSVLHASAWYTRTFPAVQSAAGGWPTKFGCLALHMNARLDAGISLSNDQMGSGAGTRPAVLSRSVTISCGRRLNS